MAEKWRQPGPFRQIPGFLAAYFAGFSTVFAGQVPPDLFPDEMPGHAARGRALQEIRAALSKISNAIKSDRVAKWKDRVKKSASGAGKLA